MSKKMGRPTDNPKTERINVRLDAKCSDIINRYISKYNVSKAEAIRRGVERLDDDL